jgi:hypothetical protein
MDQFVNIQFADREKISVNRFNLNINNSMTEHRAFENKQREPIVLHSQLEGNRRVLTVRTQNVLVNQTDITYKVCIFFAHLQNG